MNTLVIIPARGGNKGIPYKNIKQLQGRPFIYYIVGAARCITDDAHICISTDDNRMIRTIEGYGISAPFKHPDALATDTTGTYEVLLHALNCYEKRGELIDVIILLQATLPFRTDKHIKEAMKLYRPDIDMVTGAKETDSNSYCVCSEKDRGGFLHLSRGDGSYTRRQDYPPVYEYNGATYITSLNSLKSTPLSKSTKRIKYVTGKEHPVGLDTTMDQYMTEHIINTDMVTL